MPVGEEVQNATHARAAASCNPIVDGLNSRLVKRGIAEDEQCSQRARTVPESAMCKKQGAAQRCAIYDRAQRDYEACMKHNFTDVTAQCYTTGPSTR